MDHDAGRRELSFDLGERGGVHPERDPDLTNVPFALDDPLREPRVFRLQRMHGRVD